jgi:hypothetical protein
MQRAKAFFYVCAGLCLLAVAYHLGASSALAQAPGNSIVSGSGGCVVTANGDVYVAPGVVGPSSNWAQWSRVGNVFSGGPIPTTQQSWGQLKAKYR